MFPSLRSPRNIIDNNVSATIWPRLPGPLEIQLLRRVMLLITEFFNEKDWKSSVKQRNENGHYKKIDVSP